MSSGPPPGGSEDALPAQLPLGLDPNPGKRPYQGRRSRSSRPSGRRRRSGCSGTSPRSGRRRQREPSVRSRQSALVTCSQTIRSRLASSVMPLHLKLGRITSSTPLSGVYLRRTSPGMSENRRYPSGCQIGPSVNVKPVATRSTADPPHQLVDRRRLRFDADPVSVLVTTAPFVGEMLR